VDRFRVAQTLIQATQIGIATGLAAGTGDTPIWRLPPAAAFGAVIMVAVLGVISAQMPSWGASKAVAAAASAAEVRKAGE
jgi:hypothetical protein